MGKGGWDVLSCGATGIWGASVGMSESTPVLFSCLYFPRRCRTDRDYGHLWSGWARLWIFAFFLSCKIYPRKASRVGPFSCSESLREFKLLWLCGFVCLLLRYGVLKIRGAHIGKGAGRPDRCVPAHCWARNLAESTVCRTTEKWFAVLNYNECIIWVIDLRAIDLVSLISHINEKYWTALSSIICGVRFPPVIIELL